MYAATVDDKLAVKIGAWGLSELPCSPRHHICVPFPAHVHTNQVCCCNCTLLLLLPSLRCLGAPSRRLPTPVPCLCLCLTPRQATRLKPPPPPTPPGPGDWSPKDKGLKLNGGRATKLVVSGHQFAVWEAVEEEAVAA